MSFIDASRDPFGPPRPTEQPRPQPENQLRAFLDFLAARRLLILAVAAAVMALGTYYYMRQTPLYTSEAVVILDSRGRDLVNYAPDTSTNKAPDVYSTLAIEDQLEIIGSRDLARKVIDKLGLWNDPDFAAVASDEAGGETVVGDRAQFEEDTISNFLDGVSASVRGRSSAIGISYTSPEPEKAARLANAVAEAYVLDQLNAKFEASRLATEWLTEQVDKLAAQLQKAEDAVERYKAQAGLYGETGESILDKQLADLNAQLTTARAARAQVQAQYDQTVRGSGNVSEVVKNPVIGSLRGREAELSATLAELSNRYQDRHPRVLHARSELAEIRRQISVETQRIVGSMKSDLAAAIATEKAIQQRLNELEANAGDKRQGIVGLRALEREAQSTRNLYEAMLARLKSTESKDEIQRPDARLLSAAPLPTDPSSPRAMSLVLGVLALVSFLFGVAVAFIVDRLDNGFRNFKQVEDSLGVAAIGMVPEIRRRAKGGHDAATYVVHKPLSAFSEGIRSVQTALALSNVDHPPRVILITSAIPGEGKTTLAISLARLMARSDKRVALVDLDLRRPSVLKQAEAEPRPVDILEILAGAAELPAAARQDRYSPLDIFGVNQPAVNPPDILTSNATARLLKMLRNAYDYVIVDSAPTLPVNDTKLLVRHVDTTVFAVRWEKTSRDAVAAAIAQLRDVNAQIAGVVLNRSDARRSTIASYGANAYSNYNAYYQA